MVLEILAGISDGELISTEWLMVFVFVVGVVAWGFRMRKASQSLEGSFLAGRKVPGFIASLSTVATNLNANDFIGGAGFAYGVGVIAAHGSWVNGLSLVIVSLFVVHKLRRLRVFTLGEWLERRYSPSVGIAYSLVWSFIWMLFNLGLYIYAGSLVLHTLVGWDLYYSIVILAVIAAFYTLIGGFGAVVATDVLQISLMFFPFIFLATAVWLDVGSVTTLASWLPPDKGVFWTRHTCFGPLEIALGGIFFMGMSYWSSEAQVIQRPLSAKSEEDATISFLGATFWLSLLCPLLIAVPALSAIHYFPGLDNPDHAMPSLIRRFMPRGLYGVTVVGLVAGVFSSCDSQINAFCTMFTSDIYKRLLRPNRSEAHYLKASKVAGVIFTMAAIGTALVFTQRKEGMMLFAISVLATIMPPFGAVTVLGALIKRVNRFGALAGLIGGGVVALTLAVLSERGHLASIAEQTLYFRTMVTFLTTAILCYAVSLCVKVDPVPMAEPSGASSQFTPRVLAMLIVLLIGVGGMTAFWTFCFGG